MHCFCCCCPLRLLSSGRELITFYATNDDQDQRQRADIKLKLDVIVDRWERIQTVYRIKSTKIHDLKVTMHGIEERVAQIRGWLYDIEIELAKPLRFESTANGAFDRAIHDNEKIQRSIEKESGNIGEVLNLCEILVNDMGTWGAHIDTNGLSTAVDSLERRWKNVCCASAERKHRIHSVWTLLLEVDTIAGDQAAWVERQGADLARLGQGVERLTKGDGEQRIQMLEKKIQEIEQRKPQMSRLAQSYSKLVKTNGIDPANMRQLTDDSKRLLQRYAELVPRALDTIGTLNMDQRKRREFTGLHDKSVLALSNISAELTRLEHQEQLSAADRVRRLDIAEQELKLCEPDLTLADNLGLEIMKRSGADDIDAIQSLVDEYQLLWQEVTARITTIRTRLRQEEPCREADSAVQVNTLPRLNRATSITARDAYLQELTGALSECHDNLAQLGAEVNSAERKPGSQVVQRLISKCQSSIELARHLSGILGAECFCSDEEAAVAEVNAIQAQYDGLLAAWRAKERQLENRYLSRVDRLFQMRRTILRHAFGLMGMSLIALLAVPIGFCGFFVASLVLLVSFPLLFALFWFLALPLALIFLLGVVLTRRS